MDKNRKNHSRSVLSLREIFLFLQDKFSGKKQNVIERKLLDSPFEEEAVEGFSGISEEEAREDLAYLRAAIRQRSGKNATRPLFVWQIAAAVFLFGVFAAGIWFILDSDRELQLAQDQNRALPQENRQLKQELQSRRETPEIGAKPKEPDAAKVPAMPKSGSAGPPGGQDHIPAEEEIAKRETEPAEAVRSDTPTDAEKVQTPDIIPERWPAAAYIDSSVSGIRRTDSSAEQPKSDDVPAAAPAAARTADALQEIQAVGSKSEITTGFRAISGSVLSAADRAPVAGVRVSVIGLQSDVYTGLDGSFDIVIPAGRDMALTVYRPGYATTSINTAGMDTLQVYMEPESGENARRIIIGTNPPDRPVYDPPTPLGSRVAFSNYMESKLAVLQGNAVVRIRFTVTVDGSLHNIRILSTDTPADIAEQAIKALEEGPPWYPAKKNGIPAADMVDLRIRY
jgi:hypothetical protein